MKKIILLLGLISISIFGFTQKVQKFPNGVEIPDGKLKLGATSVISTALEINRAAVGTKSNLQAQTDSLKTAIKTKADTSEVNLRINNINPHDSVYFKDETYTKDQVSDMVAIASESPLLSGLKTLDSKIVALPFNAYLPLPAAATMTDGRNYTIMFLVTDTIKANYIGYSVSVIGDYTADNYNGLDVCELIAGNLVQIQKTANDGLMWKTVGYAHKAITEVTLYPNHIYYLRAVWNASATVTAPSYSTFGNPWQTVPNSTIRPSIYNSKTDLVSGDAASSYNPFTVLFGIWLEYIL